MNSIYDKNQLLNNYKNLLSSYEDHRQLSEKLISYNTDSVLTCSSLSLKNGSRTVTRWCLYSLDGTVLYTSGKFGSSRIVTLYLNYIGIPEGTLFKLKALVVAGDDSVADIILKSAPLGSVTGYFELSGTVFRTALKYKGTTNPW